MRFVSLRIQRLAACPRFGELWEACQGSFGQTDSQQLKVARLKDGDAVRERGRRHAYCAGRTTTPQFASRNAHL